MALAGGGRFTTASVSQHTITNAEVISRFLPVDTTFAEDSDGKRHIVSVGAQNL
jgi:RNA 3'-terminal phosphate cyclase (ATP)